AISRQIGATSIRSSIQSNNFWITIMPPLSVLDHLSIRYHLQFSVHTHQVVQVAVCVEHSYRLYNSDHCDMGSSTDLGNLDYPPKIRNIPSVYKLGTLLVYHHYHLYIPTLDVLHQICTSRPLVQLPSLYVQAFLKYHPHFSLHSQSFLKLISFAKLYQLQYED